MSKNEQSRIESKVILILAGFLLSIGFYVGDVSNQNYDLLNQFAKTSVWSILFGTYAITKFFAFVWNVPSFISKINSLFGIWLWNYVFLSFVIFDETMFSPAELLLLLPLLIEFWVMLDDTPKVCRKT